MAEERVAPVSVAVVTGAARGIGLAIAEALARQGVIVVATDVDGHEVAEAADRLGREGLAVEGGKLDVTDPSTVEAFFEEVGTARGGIDVLVNCAGVGQVLSETVQLADAEWSRVLSVNLTGAFRCCRAAGRMMQSAGSGSIVNISSINGRRAAPLAAAYNASKAALISLTQTLALELGPSGVRVNALCPGPILTDLNRPIIKLRARDLGITEDEMMSRIHSSIPLRRWGTPQDVAAIAVFLCSDAASWITGEAIGVNGGLDAVPAQVPQPLVLPPLSQS